MNDLLISVAKERIIPTQPGIIDYPNEHTESQLYRMAVYITQNIIHSYYLIFRWNRNEESSLTLALHNCFPQSWLAYAETSPHHYLELQKVITPYRLNLSEGSIERIHKIIEFLCYEIIESSVIQSCFLPIQQIGPIYLKKGVDMDPTLNHMIQRHNIILTDYLKVKPGALRIQSPIRLSNKGIKLIRIYIEQLVQRILCVRIQSHTLTLADIQYYIKVYAFS
jgi:hypothetical protein